MNSRQAYKTVMIGWTNRCSLGVYKLNGAVSNNGNMVTVNGLINVSIGFKERRKFRLIKYTKNKQGHLIMWKCKSNVLNGEMGLIRLF